MTRKEFLNKKANYYATAMMHMAEEFETQCNDMCPKKVIQIATKKIRIRHRKKEMQKKIIRNFVVKKLNNKATSVIDLANIIKEKCFKKNDINVNKIYTLIKLLDNEEFLTKQFRKNNKIRLYQEGEIINGKMIVSLMIHKPKL